jgi:hypothetical protein
MLLGVFFFFTWLKTASAKNNQKYPTRTNCVGITDLFTDDATNVTDWSSYQALASYDKQATLDMIGGGYYQCYCKSTQGPKDDLCHDYRWDQTVALGLTNAVTALVSVVNIVLRTSIQMMVDVIGYDTNSERFSIIMVTSFLSAFVNTGLIALLVLADLEYAPIPFCWVPLYNQYSDIQRDWYTSMGSQIVKTMMIQAFMPIVEIGMGVSQKWVFQWLDSGFPCCRPKRDPPIEEG